LAIVFYPSCFNPQRLPFFQSLSDFIGLKAQHSRLDRRIERLALHARDGQ
jgi:hypothetical protein